MQLNLKSVFEKIGLAFTNELRQNIEKQNDIRGVPFRPIAPSTAEARQRSKGLGVRSIGKKKLRSSKKTTGILRSTFSVPITRLLFTGRFKQNAFKSQAEADQVTVYVNDNMYSGDEQGKRSLVTYADIVRYNNRDSAERNPKVKQAPLVFPSTVTDIKRMKSFEIARRLLVAEKKNILRQMGAEATKKVQVHLSI